MADRQMTIDEEVALVTEVLGPNHLIVIRYAIGKMHDRSSEERMWPEKLELREVIGKAQKKGTAGLKELFHEQTDQYSGLAVACIQALLSAILLDPYHITPDDKTFLREMEKAELVS